LKVLVIGAAGMNGRKFMEWLADDGALGGGKIEVARCVDIVAPAPRAASIIRAYIEDEHVGAVV
jgi:hypothetical protein